MVKKKDSLPPKKQATKKKATGAKKKKKTNKTVKEIQTKKKDVTQDSNDEFNLRLEECKKFRDKHGHCMIPNNYNENKSGLGFWAQMMRHNYQCKKPSNLIRKLNHFYPKTWLQNLMNSDSIGKPFDDISLSCQPLNANNWTIKTRTIINSQVT